MTDVPEAASDFNGLLLPIRAATKLEAVVLTDSTGQVIGSAADESTTPETLDALLALARRVIERPPETAQSQAMGETLFFDWEGRQAVCRMFKSGELTWVLAVLAPRAKPYKQALSKLVKAVQDATAPPKVAKTPRKSTRKKQPEQRDVLQ